MRPLPIWLYEKREDPYLRIRRYGSRRPLRACLTIVDGGSLAPSYLFALGRLGLQLGPVGGIAEGHASMPPGCRRRVVYESSRGLGAGVSWDAAT